MPSEDSLHPVPRRLTSAQWLLIALLSVSGFLAVVTGFLIAWMMTRGPAGKSIEEPRISTTDKALAGALDETFYRTGRGGDFISMALQSDGKILFSGLFDEMEGERHKSIARLNDDGTLDARFNAQAAGSVHAVAVQADGKIVLAGDFGSVNRISFKTVARPSRTVISAGWQWTAATE
jgi:hypothetical protein